MRQPTKDIMIKILKKRKNKKLSSDEWPRTNSSASCLYSLVHPKRPGDCFGERASLSITLRYVRGP